MVSGLWTVTTDNAALPTPAIALDKRSLAAFAVADWSMPAITIVDQALFVTSRLWVGARIPLKLT
jgi:hypothetical protein